MPLFGTLRLPELSCSAMYRIIPEFPACLLFLLSLTAFPAFSATGQPASAAGIAEAPQVCLVLSGGGARGAAHVGVLKVLEEFRIPVDCIVGTSAGAAIGGLYAAGKSPDEIAAFLRQMDWDKALRDGPNRANLDFRRKQDDARYLLRMELGYAKGKFYLPKGFIAGRNLDFLLKTELLNVADVQDFDRLPIRFRAIATDIESGEMVVMKQGDLATALRASMAVPGVFAPVERQGRLLVDGGLTRNLAVEVARDMGADVVIAVDVGTPLLEREQLGNVVGLSLQVLNVLTQQNVHESRALLQQQDVLIDPDLQTVEATDFGKVERAIVLGAAAARDKHDELQDFAVDGLRYWKFLNRQRSAPATLPVIDYIEIRNNRLVSAQRILSRIHSAEGRKLDLDTLEKDLERVYEMGDFESVSFSLVGDRRATNLVIDVEERSWGLQYLRFGLQIAEDFEGGGNYNLLLGHTRSNLNRLGGEWKNELQVGEEHRLFSEFYQPVSYSGRLFIAPQLEYRSESIDLFSGSRRYAEYRGKEAYIALDTGWSIDNTGEIRAGILRGEAGSEPRIGALDLPDYNHDVGAWRLRLRADTRDKPHFPRNGITVDLEARAHRAGIGNDLEYDRVHLNTTFAESRGPNTLLFSLEYGSSFGADLPLYDKFELGGFLSLSGFRHEQLRGNDALALRAIYYRQVYTLPAFIGNAVYLGGSLEAGNVWNTPADRLALDDLQAGSALFAGADTIFGPAFLGVGVNESGDSAFYLFIGKSF